MNKRFIKITVVAVVFACMTVVALNEHLFSSNASEIESSDYDPDSYEVDSDDNTEVEEVEIADNIDVSEDIDVINVMYDYYKSIPEEVLEKFRQMTDEEIIAKKEELDEKYSVGNICNEEDQQFIAYLQYEYEAQVVSRARTTRKHKIKNSKTCCGVTTSYEGHLETWTGHLNCKFGAVVNVKTSKKVKSVTFTVFHKAYGVISLDTSGKIPVPKIGVLYSGNIKSKSYTGSFKFNKFKKYQGVLVSYVQTWGRVDVETNSGEYCLETKVYKTVE